MRAGLRVLYPQSYESDTLLAMVKTVSPSKDDFSIILNTICLFCHFKYLKFIFGGAQNMLSQNMVTSLRKYFEQKNECEEGLCSSLEAAHKT